MSNPPVNNATLLERRLTLVTWFAQTLGYASNANMLRKLEDSGEEWGDRYNHVLEKIKNSNNNILASTWQVLEELDGQIHTDWNTINRHRGHRLNLKYFQYLAALSTALFLHRLTQSADDFLTELNDFAQSLEELQNFDNTRQLHKLAFWMATGSGKTLLMHLNYRQFLRHRRALFEPDNLLLLTPNEELSRQHMEEMRASGIPCFRHGESADLLNSEKDAVRVIEITKIIPGGAERKKGKGESVPVDEFAGRNLLFVDEGHKGVGGEAWFAVRDELAQDGFVFEYSATFGQALNGAVRDERSTEYVRFAEYARAIAFDYSYRYFHKDGFGKDFNVLNIGGQGMREEQIDTLMLGNLLSFFQQRLAFREYRQEFYPYQVESPLLLMLGASVTGGRQSESKLREQTDIVNVLRFLQNTAQDRKNGKPWLEKTVKQILNRSSGLQDSNGKDVFTKRFPYLYEKFKNDMRSLCRTLRAEVFHAAAPGVLRFSLLKQDKDEIVLKVGDDSPPFGLVYVGNTSKLRDLAAAQVEGLAVNEDAIQRPLFATVNQPNSPVNILIGAKKFMEGWSSWRVSGMGLLNVGKSEGAQIIQLFGRGIRLKGKNFSLKRSSSGFKSDGEVPQYLTLLETLNIFAVRANFMANFRTYLEREGVSMESIIVPIKVDEILLKKDLLYPLFPPAEHFAQAVAFAPQENISVTLDLRTVSQNIIGKNEKFNWGTGGGESNSVSFNKYTKPYAGLLDFDRLYLRLLDYKQKNGRHNLFFHRDRLPEVLEKCEIWSGEAAPKFPSFAAADRLHDSAYAALCKYADRLYYVGQKRWETDEIKYTPLAGNGKETSWEAPRQYTLRLPAGKKDEAEEIRESAENLVYLCDQDCETGALPRVYFDRHLYLPLLLENNAAEVQISPPGLTESETDFVRKLRAHLCRQPLPKGCELVLLRNLGKGKGIGFYENEGFFPDFILWLKNDKKQRIIFVEPHGMLHAPAYQHDFKVRLHETLQELSRKLGNKLRGKNVSRGRGVVMDSFVISRTPHRKLKRRYGNGKWSEKEFKKHHILFIDDENLIAAILDTFHQ